jgi:hypothetical protein
LFAIPTTEGIIHAIQHSNEQHCSALNEKHFHEQEHHCALCDYNLIDHFSNSNDEFVQILNTTLFKYQQKKQTNFAYLQFQNVKLRGPPKYY